MANRDAAFGFVPLADAYGAPASGALKRYYIGTGDGNNLFIGDPVALSGSGGPDGTPGIVRATAGAGSSAGDGPIGVVCGFENLTPDNLSRTYRPASTAMYVLVNDNPNTVYMIQEDSASATLAVTDIGLNVNFALGTGNTLTGVSAAELAGNTAAVTATLDCRILGLLKRPDNAIGDNAIWLVKFNNHPHNVAEGE